MDTKALRQKVLDLAIRGKLVPQDPNDEPASVLLERIRLQKQQMVKEGKLKPKDIKNDTIIFVGEDSLHYEKFADGSVKCIEDEIPFDLPEGWAWVRLGSIAGMALGKMLDGAKNKGSLRPYLRNINVRWGTFELSDVLEMRFEDSELERYSICHGDLVICEGGEPGRCAVWQSEEVVFYQKALHRVRAIEVLPEYLYYVIRHFILSNQYERYYTGTTIKHLTGQSLQILPIPLPPLSEQKSIVKILQRIIKSIDKIETEKNEALSLVSLAKSKVLDLAIRGQLVPQDPTDEPASILLERIRAEKEELIRQGSIKRDKRESIIFRGEDNSYYLYDGQITVDINDDLPFDIPDSWLWVRLKDVFLINPRNKLHDSLEVSFIPMPLIDDGYSGKHTAEVRQWKKVKTGFTHFAEGDIGIAKITPCFENRKSTVFNNLANGYGAGTTELHILRPYSQAILTQYLLAYVKSDYFVENGKRTFTGAVGQQRISKEYVENAYFPIPPITEQERIVKHIRAIFEYLNMISDALS